MEEMEISEGGAKVIAIFHAQGRWAVGDGDGGRDVGIGV